MVRTKRIQREHIIDGAYQLIINEGFKKFHARNIAQQVSCSTQPIYREFSNLSELKSVLIKRIIAKYQDFLDDQQPTSIRELSEVIARYACDYPDEFHRFFLQDQETIQRAKELTKVHYEAVTKKDHSSPLLFNFYWHYCIGKATLTINNTEEHDDIESFQQFLEQ
ncbi:hypothetical protein NRIC_12600 [Enterococcus florum]|uniref:HTH tetR-type domain-containing protein n=1 Tax=Enterococcus florum TaxID=2480627 RepID=A0A4V0WPC4_9ENTE|nr:TetR/AcrR family transcriptional regulator [Enterococcus florum]GCF93369.1 hypothetical protein NRIC_12600 [Enterococcus florum]